MKLHDNEIEVSRSEGIEESFFGIGRGQEKHIISILRDKLYSNKVKAVVREYSTNALDAHIEANCPERPFEVFVPSEWDSNFKIRDFGNGLTEQEVRELYVQYGISTKRHSNDAIGQLGLGCKSGFAYNDVFNITSFKDGEKKIYSAYIDETELGKIALLSTEPTEEENGVEISIPVKSGDVSRFIQEIQEIFKYFKVQPIINNSNLSFNTRKEPILEENNWRITQDISVAIMGSIGYPLEDKSIPNLSSTEKGLLNSGIEIEFPIGDLSISASREKLEYTDLTINSIKSQLENISLSIKDKILSEFEKCQSLIEAKRLYYKYFNSSQYYSGLSCVLKNIFSSRPSFSWNNQTIDNNQLFRIDHYRDSVKIEIFTLNENSFDIISKPLLREKTNSVYVKNSDILFYEKDTKSKHIKRIFQILKDKKKKAKDGQKYEIVLLDFVFVKEEDRKEIIKRYFSDIVIEKLSDVEVKIDKSTDSSGISVAKNPKHMQKAFAFNGAKCDTFTYPYSAWFETDEVDLDQGGIYVEIDKFRWIISGGDSDGEVPIKIQKFLLYLKNDFKYTDSIKIFAFKSKMLDKIDKTKWTRFEDFLRKNITKYLKVQAIDQAFADKQEYDLVMGSYILSQIDKLSNNIEAPNSLILEIKKYFEEVKNSADKISNHKDLLNKLKEMNISLENVSPGYDLKCLIDHCIDRYPLLNTLNFFKKHNSYYYLNLQAEDYLGIAQYINLIDSNKEIVK